KCSDSAICVPFSAAIPLYRWDSNKGGSMLSENKALVQKVFEEIYNRKRKELIISTYAPDCMGSSPDGPFQGWEGVESTFEKYAAAFPDFRIEIIYMIAEEDRVAVYYSFVGTNTGPLLGFPGAVGAGRVAGQPGFVVGDT